MKKSENNKESFIDIDYEECLEYINEDADTSANSNSNTNANTNANTSSNATSTINDVTNTTYKEVVFYANDNIDASEIVQIIISKGVPAEDIEYNISVIDKSISIKVRNILVDTYVTLNRILSVRKGAQKVSGAVGTVTNTAINVANTAIQTVGVPIARTAVKTGFGILKTALGAATKIGAMVATEAVKGGREAIYNIKNDAYIQEAKNTINTRSNGNGFAGRIISE